MTHLLSRRACAASAVGALSFGAMPARAQGQSGPQRSVPDTTHAHAAIAALEAHNGGRLGVAALDNGSRRRLAWRADERFPMCSTYKFLAGAAVLHAVDHGALALNQHVPYSQADLLGYAPITRKHVAAGFMTVEGLAAAAVQWSDNTAANLLLGLIGGPPGWTRYAASLGDTVSRLDRIEPELNTAIPGDQRDTTTPEAAVHDLQAVLFGKALSEASRQQLSRWMQDSTITGNLLRAGMPQGWRAGDKSGAGGNGTRNDIGFLLPGRTAPILVAAYYTGSTAPAASRDRVIAEIGRIVAATFA